MADRTRPPRYIKGLGDISAELAITACNERIANERAEAKLLVTQMGEPTAAWLETASDADLDAAVDTSLKQAARLNALAIDLGKGKGAIPNTLTELTDAVRSAVNKEKACRADKRCADARTARKAEEQFFASVVQPMCQADQNRETALKDMSRERANPSGYVNKAYLHDKGAVVQQSQEQLAAMAPAYVKVRHHAWRGYRSECQMPEADNSN